MTIALRAPHDRMGTPSSAQQRAAQIGAWNKASTAKPAAKPADKQSSKPMANSKGKMPKQSGRKSAQPSGSRNQYIIVGVLTVILGLVIWWDRTPDYAFLNQDQLAAIPDNQLMDRAYTELAWHCASDPAAWHHFKEPARNLWALATVEMTLTGVGFAGFEKMAGGIKDAGGPGFADARDAAAAMGLDLVAKDLDAASAHPDTPAGQAAAQEFTLEMHKPETAKARLAYLRANLADIVHP